jgi:hypothetical protein
VKNVSSLFTTCAVIIIPHTGEISVSYREISVSRGTPGYHFY